MPLANEQLLEIDIIIGRHLTNVEGVLVSVMECQADMLKLLSAKLPDLNSEERKHYRDFQSRMMFTLDQHRASLESFRAAIENLENAE
jgi:hypothetical protein